jgi:deoxyribodipyrimidine photolyase
MKRSLVWFKTDLRLHDNEVLVESISQSDEIVPVYCFDVETDKYNTTVGYTGRAVARIKALEEIEKSGDVITWQDLSTSESQQAVIEKISFTRMTPPDRNFDGFGGVIEIAIRTV